MDCPQCGYVMDPFDKTCPRCARLGTEAVTTVKASTAVSSPQPMPQPFSTPPPMPVQPMSPLQQAQMRRGRPDQREARSGPVVGVAAIVILILVCVLNLFSVLVGLLAFVVGSALSGMFATLTHDNGLSGASQVFLTAILGLSLPAALKITGAIGFMSGKRWGYYLFLAMSVATAIFLLAFTNGTIGSKIFVMLLFDVGPAILVYTVGRDVWEMLE